MALYHGTGVNFGVSSSLAGVTGLFQTFDHNQQASNESIMDGGGEFQVDTTYGEFSTATFEWVISGAGPAGSVAATLPTVGSLLTVTDSQYTQIAQTNWIVRSVEVRGSNTTAKRATATLWRAAGITS